MISSAFLSATTQVHEEICGCAQGGLSNVSVCTFTSVSRGMSGALSIPLQLSLFIRNGVIDVFCVTLGVQASQ